MNNTTQLLQNLNEALANKVYIEQPVFLAEGGKIGHCLEYKNRIVCDTKQFVLTPYGVNEGPAVQSIFNDDNKKDIEDITNIKNIVIAVENWSKKIRFIQLILPGICIHASLHRHKNILGRYLEDYLSMCDLIIPRWDFLIQKLD